MDFFNLIQKSNNVFGQVNVLLSLLLSSLILIEGKHEESVFEVLGGVWLVILPLAISSEFSLKNFHYQIDIIELDLFLFLVENPPNKLVDFPSSPSQLRVKMIFNVVVASIRHFLSYSRPFVANFTVEL